MSSEGSQRMAALRARPFLAARHRELDGGSGKSGGRVTARSPDAHLEVEFAGRGSSASRGAAGGSGACARVRRSVALGWPRPTRRGRLSLRATVAQPRALRGDPAVSLRSRAQVRGSRPGRGLQCRLAIGLRGTCGAASLCRWDASGRPLIATRLKSRPAKPTASAVVPCQSAHPRGDATMVGAGFGGLSPALLSGLSRRPRQIRGSPSATPRRNVGLRR